MTESIFSPSVVPPDPDTFIFRTTNHAFVAAALAADLFEYVGAEKLGTNTVVLKLADPNHIADGYQRRFASGLFPHVNPSVHNAARGFIREEMRRHGQDVHRG